MFLSFFTIDLVNFYEVRILQRNLKIFSHRWTGITNFINEKYKKKGSETPKL